MRQFVQLVTATVLAGVFGCSDGASGGPDAGAHDADVKHENLCCINGVTYTCPSAAAALSCFQSHSPGECAFLDNQDRCSVDRKDSGARDATVRKDGGGGAPLCVEGTSGSCTSSAEKWTGSQCCVTGYEVCVDGTSGSCTSSSEEWTGSKCCVKGYSTCVDGTSATCTGSSQEWTGSKCCVK